MRINLFTIVLLCFAIVLGAVFANMFFNVPNQKLMLMVVGGLVFYPILRYPIVGLYLFFIISPFIPYFRRLYYLAYRRPTSDPLIIVGDVILAIMLLGLFYTFRENRVRDQDVASFKVAIFGYLGYLLLRVFFHTDLPLAEAMLAFKYYGPVVICFFIGIIYAPQLKHIKAIWLITIGIGIITALYGIKQLYFGYSVAETLWFTSISFHSLFINNVARPFSVFQAPAAFADYLQLAVIGVIILTGWKKNSIKPILLVFLPLYCAGILITSVRSSWIGLAVSFMLWFIIGAINNNRSRIVAIIVLTVLFMAGNSFVDSLGGSSNTTTPITAVATVMPNQQNLDMLISDRSAALVNPMEEHSFVSRLATWRMIVACTGDPAMALFGRGLGAFSADSLYFTYLAEFGYPGLIFIVVLLIVLIAKAFSLLNTLKDRRLLILCKGILIMNIIFAVTGITGSHFNSFPGDAYFWFFNGVLIKLSSIDRTLAAESEDLI